MSLCVCRELLLWASSAALTQWAQAWPAVSFTRSPTDTFILEVSRVLQGEQKQWRSCQRSVRPETQTWRKYRGNPRERSSPHEMFTKAFGALPQTCCHSKNHPGWRICSCLEVWMTGVANQTHLMWRALHRDRINIFKSVSCGHWRHDPENW